MKTTKEYISLLSQFKKEHKSDYNIKKIGIFGSVAREEQKGNSDIDIYVDTPKMSLLDMGGLVYDLEKKLGVNVDLVHSSNNLRPTFLQRIKKEMVYV